MNAIEVPVTPALLKDLRIEFPLHIPLTKTLVFAVALFVVQQLEHTTLAFSMLFFAFVILSNIAFNVAGGFARASGAYIFLFAMLTCIVGVTWKAVLGEPANSNLLVPSLDMACYTVSMFMLLMVALLNKLLTGRSKGMAPGNVDYTLAALGCLAVALGQLMLNKTVSGGPGSLLSILNQISQFFPLAVILGTIGAIRDSGGRRSINFVNGITMVMLFYGGSLAFSKQGMYLPMVCWLAGAAFGRLRLRSVHYVVISICAVLAYTVVPLIGEGRTLVPQNANDDQRTAIVLHIVTHLGEAKEEEAEANAAIVAFQGKSGYYNTPQGLVERLSILSADDSFINYSAKGNFIGYQPVIDDYENFIPHFILPDKPVPIGGNYYAHEIGGFLAPDDDSTGISFSPVAEAYHLGGWTGLILLLPAIWLSLFVSIDSICGDMRRSPWGLLLVVMFAHAAAESLLGSLIWITGFGNLGVIVAIIFCTRFAPVIGALFYGKDRSTIDAPPARIPQTFPLR